MAHGVEGRVPFLDAKLADFAFRLPDRLKVHRGRGKWLLRRWLDTGLPASKPFARKRGFTVPVGAWIAEKGRQLGPLVDAQPGVAEACRPGRWPGCSPMPPTPGPEKRRGRCFSTRCGIASTCRACHRRRGLRYLGG